ncbi:hypothetical protein SAMN04488118_10596 [Epibacterium ulvae]|uniref:Beta/Gamma crystallin n=1 Tax=Epibacterium ulvae TaxID=1156985 RepID=A0A1G5QP59_9RHOB|nr:hypothetical protein [Epibacterium ulvae]SCZ63635.1 hypothetical protein SAMN04488118_10596 [Epibacterium ulvae]
MRLMILATTAAMLHFSAATAHEATSSDVPNIDELVSDSVGYFGVRPNVVIIEGEYRGTHICQFDVTDADFAAFAVRGELDTAENRVVCMPIQELLN